MKPTPWMIAIALLVPAVAVAGQNESDRPTLVEVSPLLPTPPPGVLSTVGYSPTEQEKPFLDKVTEKNRERFTFLQESAEKTVYSPEEKAYSLAAAEGKYVGWFGIVREISRDSQDGRTRLLVEHKYFDGMTDSHLQVVSLFGAGDFAVTLLGKDDEIPRLGLVKVYGAVTMGDDGLPLVSADYIRVWDWGLFTFMAYGQDKSNPKWVKLRQVKEGDAYSSWPTNLFYKERLGAHIVPAKAPQTSLDSVEKPVRPSSTSSPPPLLRTYSESKPDWLISPTASDGIKQTVKLFSTGTPEEIRASYNALPAAERNSPDGIIILAALLFIEKRNEEAAKELLKLGDSKLVPAEKLLDVALDLIWRKSCLETAEILIQSAGRIDPDDPMVDYRLAQCLMAQGKYEEGWQAAETAKAKYIREEAAGKRIPAWMLMETIELEGLRIEVHFNLYREEMRPPDDGIICPLRFMIWKPKPEAAFPEEIIDSFDYEEGRKDGKPHSFTLGKTFRKDEGVISIDLQYFDTKPSYAVIRAAVMAFAKSEAGRTYGDKGKGDNIRATTNP